MRDAPRITEAAAGACIVPRASSAFSGSWFRAGSGIEFRIWLQIESRIEFRIESRIGLRIEPW